MGLFDFLTGGGKQQQKQQSKPPLLGPETLPQDNEPAHRREYRTRQRGILGWLRDAWSGWLGSKGSPGTQVEYDLTHERVAAGPRGVVMPWFAPFIDERTGETQAMRIAYRRMIADPNVKSALLGKVLGVAALDLTVIPAVNDDGTKDEVIAEFVRWQLAERLAGGLTDFIWNVFSGGLIDGYSVCEKVWMHETQGQYRGKYVLTDVKAKDVGSDVILQTDQFKNVIGVQALRYNSGQVYSPANFVIYRHLPLYNSPVGMSDFRAVYGRWHMLDTVIKLRGMGAEKRALPVMMGEYETNSQKPALEASLAAVRSQNWLSIPRGVRVQALEIAGAADDVFRSFVADLKEDIFLGITGATLQALTGQAGQIRGNSQVHQDTADLLKWHLCKQVESLLNDWNYGLIRDIVDLNYLADRYPKAMLSSIDPQEVQALIQVDTGLKGLGLKLSKEDLYERYGRKPPKDKDDDLGDEPPPGGGAPPGGGGGADVQPGGDDQGSDMLQQLGFAEEQAGVHPVVHKFLEQKKDKRGYPYCLEKGKRVPCPQHTQSVSGTRGSGEDPRAQAEQLQAHMTSLLEHPEKAKDVRASLVQRVLGKGKELGAALKRVSKLVGKEVWDRLPTKAQKLLAGIGHLLGHVGKFLLKIEHGLEETKHFFQKMAVEAAKQRGLPAKHVEKVAKGCAVVDTILAWTVNIPILHDVLHHVAHIGGGAGFVLAKLAFYVPVGSLAYLAVSMAKNPLATIEAAFQTLKGHDHGAHPEESGHTKPEGQGVLDRKKDKIPLMGQKLAGVLTQRLHEAKDPDWYFALFLAAFDKDRDPAKALALADAATRRKPTPDADGIPPEEYADWFRDYDVPRIPGVPPLRKHGADDQVSILTGSTKRLDLFLEQKKDKRGRPYCIDKGKRVKCPEKGTPAASKKKGAAKKEEPTAGKKKPAAAKPEKADAHAVAEELRGLMNRSKKPTQAEKKALSARIATLSAGEINALKKSLGVKHGGGKAGAVEGLHEAVHAHGREQAKRHKLLDKVASKLRDGKKVKAADLDEIETRDLGALYAHIPGMGAATGKTRAKMVKELTSGELGKKPEATAQEKKKPAVRKKPAEKKVVAEKDVLNDTLHAYEKLHKEGTVKIPELLDAVKKVHPGITQEQFHDLLLKWRDEDKVTLQTLNIVEAESRGGEAITKGGKRLFYIVAHQKPESKPAEKREEKPAAPQKKKKTANGIDPDNATPAERRKEWEDNNGAAGKGVHNPRGYEGMPEGIDEHAFTRDALAWLHKTKTGMGRPTLKTMYQHMKEKHPELTIGQFQQALTQLHKDRRVVLGAWTLAPAKMPDEDLPHTFPLDKEQKYYIDKGQATPQSAGKHVKSLLAVADKAHEDKLVTPEEATRQVKDLEHLGADDLEEAAEGAGLNLKNRTKSGILKAIHDKLTERYRVAESIAV